MGEYTSGLFSRKIGIDLGTTNTAVYVKGKGIILREPSIVALQRNTGHLLAVGEKAQKMIGRTHGDIVIVKPVRDGVISNFEAARILLREFISRIYPGRYPSSLHVVINVSQDVTEIEKRAVLEAARQAGARTVYFVENPIAGAMGMNLHIEDNAANMLVDIGGGTCEAAVINLGGIANKNCIRVGGEHFDNAISRYIRRRYNFLVGERTAEEIKTSIGSALQPTRERQMEIRGTDLVSRMPGRITLNSGEITGALSELVSLIIQAIKKPLEDTPVELMDDIMTKGIILTGGGALLKDIDKVIAEKTQMPVSLSEHPLDSVAFGTGKMLSSLSLLKKLA